MRISDWSSDVCSSDLTDVAVYAGVGDGRNRLLRKRAAPDLALVRDERSDAPVARSSADTMNGLLSHAPSPIAVRLAVGGLMLGQAQALILFAAPGPISNSPRPLTVLPIGRASCRERGVQYV